MNTGTSVKCVCQKHAADLLSRILKKFFSRKTWLASITAKQGHTDDYENGKILGIITFVSTFQHKNLTLPKTMTILNLNNCSVCELLNV